VKYASIFLAGFLAACTTATPVAPEGWQLDQDRVIAVRSLPPGLAAGEHALFDALIAHAGGPTTIETPYSLNAAGSPLSGTVNYLFDHFELIAPDEATLADARTQLGIAPGAPIPLEVEADFETHAFITQRQVLLGVHYDNIEIGDIAIGGEPIGVTVAVAHDSDVALSASLGTVRWLTSCGELADSDELAAVLHTGAPCTGELVVVRRDATTTGTAWRVFPLTVE
jgi:hypothetical protein